MLTLPSSEKNKKTTVVIPPSGPNAVRLNCKSGTFSLDAKTPITETSLDVLICEITTGVGLIPPLTTPESVDKRVALLTGHSPNAVSKMSDLEKLGYYDLANIEYSFSEAIPAGFNKSWKTLTDYVKQLKNTGHQVQ